jgi:8-oxo-dGTP diphosphatase
MSEFQKFSVGVTIFVVRGDKLLMGRRKNGFASGTYGLPGGRLIEGEKMLDCAARELMEETGLTAQSFTFLNLVNDDQVKTNHYLQVSFLAEGVAGEPELREPEFCEQWQWFDLSALPSPIASSQIESVTLFLAKQAFSDHP